MVPHSVRQLLKITETKDNAIYSTEDLGLWYIPLGGSTSERATMAKQLGGDEWVSPSTTWCIQNNKGLIRTFEHPGVYKVGWEVEPY